MIFGSSDVSREIQPNCEVCILSLISYGVATFQLKSVTFFCLCQVGKLTASPWWQYYICPHNHRKTGTVTHTRTSAHLPTARTVTSPWWKRRCSALRADGFLISGHFFWLQRMQMFFWPLAPPMVCRWLQVCLAAPAGALGDMGVIGGVGVLGEMGVSGGLRKKTSTLVIVLFHTDTFSPSASVTTQLSLKYYTW